MSMTLFATFVADDQNPVGPSISEEHAPAETPRSADTEPPVPQPATPVPKIPFKNDQLAALWRVFQYGAMAVVLYFILNLLMYALMQRIASPIRLGLIAEIGLAVTALAPAFVLSRLEERPWGEYGLPPAGLFGKLFWSGAAWGLIAISILMLGLRLTGAYDIERMSLHGGKILKFAVYWGGFFLIVGVFEEFLMRGYTQFTLTKAIGFWPSALLLSSGFAAIHLNNPGETAPGIVAAGVIGFFFCLTLRRTGNLWFAVGFHASWDWGESFLYSVANSGEMSPGHLLRSHIHGPAWLNGGSAGPEGSVLLFVLMALLWIVFDRTHRKAQYPSH